MGELPKDRDKAHKVRIQSARFSMIDRQLYKRSLGGPYLMCLTPEQGQYVLAELHEGICGNYPGGRFHAPNLGPTRMVDPNRFPGRETINWDSLPDFFFKAELVPVGMAHNL